MRWQSFMMMLSWDHHQTWSSSHHLWYHSMSSSSPSHINNECSMMIDNVDDIIVTSSSIIMSIIIMISTVMISLSSLFVFSESDHQKDENKTNNYQINSFSHFFQIFFLFVEFEMILPMLILMMSEKRLIVFLRFDWMIVERVMSWWIWGVIHPMTINDNHHIHYHGTSTSSSIIKGLSLSTIELTIFLKILWNKNYTE